MAFQEAQENQYLPMTRVIHWEKKIIYGTYEAVTVTVYVAGAIMNCSQSVAKSCWTKEKTKNEESLQATSSKRRVQCKSVIKEAPRP